MIKNFVLILIAAMATYSCNQKLNCDTPKYYISGKLTNGTTGKPWVGNLDLSLSKSMSKSIRGVGYIKTDSAGYFKAEYDCDGNSWNFMSIMTAGGFYVGDDHMKFEKYFYKEMYVSDSGTANFYLEQKNPWKTDDTLFVLYGSAMSPNIYIDTLLKPFSGLYKSFRLRNYIYCGMNVAKKLEQGIPGYYGINLIDRFIKGDPFIDSVNLTY